MSCNMRSCSGKNMRRSALSFMDAVNGSLDVDDVLKSDPWKDVKTFENSEAACIQNVLNDFDNKITQEKTLKTGHSTEKKNPRTTKKSPMKSPIKDSTMDVPGTSSNTNSDVVEKKTTVNKKKGASTKPRQASKTKTITELLCNNVEEKDKRSSTTSAEDVDSIKQKMEITMNTTNITAKNLQTSTPILKKSNKIVKKRESKTENKKPKVKDSENKSKKNVQRKERQKTTKKNMKDKQGENGANMANAEENVNIKLENISECNKVNQDTSKNKVEVKKVPCRKSLPSQMEKKCKVAEIKNNNNKEESNNKETNNNKEKNAKPKKCNKNMPNQLKKKKLKEENPEKKLQESAQSKKSPRLNNAKNKKCQCKKSCNCLGGKECIEKMTQKTIKVEKAVEDLSRRITVVKKKMKCVKNSLENTSPDSDSCTDESFSSLSSYSTYSSSYSSDFHSSSSYTASDCDCSNCCCDNCTFTSSDSLNSSKNSGNNSETESASEKEPTH